MRASDRSIALGIAALAGLVLLTRLDRPMLWQDEAQTALLARSILEFGVPVGFDGLNSYSQELGVEYGEDRIWRWHPWLPF
ncbi:MAG: glycosyltransferase, partial [Myxococcota bacterium]|nr:glycosyltransferase [Myxococcota bacterium]